MLSTDDPVLSAPHEFCAKGMKPLASDGKTGACDIKNPPDYVTANTTSSMATLTPEQQLAQCGHDLAGIEPSTLALRNSKKPRNGKRNAEALEPIQEGAHSGEAKQPTRPKRKKTRRQNVYCICQQPDTGEAMVQCDQCDKWYHCRCMFLDLDKASSLDTWKCSTCDTNAATAAKGKHHRM
ncbi:hypothetical protein BX666DRAFT_1225656 [Dichotomocladium elegans]|nr:hypothetical protein BX666DRAFT_1225656 [Dichotomocladium elegans]